MSILDWFRPDQRYVRTLEALARQFFPDRPAGVTSRVLMILEQQLGVGADKLTPRARLVADLKVDDLDWVEIIMSIEKEFGFGVPREEAERIETVDDLIGYVAGRVAQQATSANAG